MYNRFVVFVHPTLHVCRTGNAPEGNAPEENAPEGNAPEGNAPEGNAPEENAPDGNAPDGNTLYFWLLVNCASQPYICFLR